MCQRKLPAAGAAVDGDGAPSSRCEKLRSVRQAEAGRWGREKRRDLPGPGRAATNYFFISNLFSFIS